MLIARAAELLEARNVHVRYLDGWQSPAKPGYEWRTGDAEAVMWHHTATQAYTPNRDKANLWVGLGTRQDDRLHQYHAGDAFPVLTVANALPAPISSGYGLEAVLEELRAGEWVTERAALPDDDWAGNRSYVNIEVVCDGVGGRVRDDVWELLEVVGICLDEAAGELGYGWQPGQRHVGHLHHTRRKIDLRDGRYRDGLETLAALVEGIRNGAKMAPMTTARWASRHRRADIEEYGPRGVLTIEPDGGEVAYWLGLWERCQPGGDLTWEYDEWQDLRDAVTVRLPIYTG